MTDFFRKRGDTYADEITVKSKKTLQPIDITGYGFLMTLDSRENPDDETTKEYQLIGTITDAPNGVVEFEPSALNADTVGSFYYDIQMTDGAGKVRTILEGKYVYGQDRTK